MKKMITMIVMLGLTGGALPAVCFASPRTERGSLTEARTHALDLLDASINYLQTVPAFDRMTLIGLMPGPVDVLPHLIKVRSTIQSADVLETRDPICNKGKAYVSGGMSPIYVCGDYIAEASIQDVAQVIIHEGFHASGIPAHSDECSAADTSILALLYSGKSSPDYSREIETGECSEYYGGLADVLKRVGKQKLLKAGVEVRLNMKAVNEMFFSALKGSMRLGVMRMSGNLPKTGFVSGKVKWLNPGNFNNGAAGTDLQVAIPGGTVEFRIYKLLLPLTVEDLEWLTNGEAR